MRLTEKQIIQIRKIANEIYGDRVRVFLFGSRTADDARGGDIDLMIEAPNEEEMTFINKIDFLTKLKIAIGDQKIDVIYCKRGAKSEIIKEALNTGIEL